MKRQWIKLYVEILDDSKIGMLPVWLRWRFVELLLVAAEGDGTGVLPPTKQLAWRLRVNEDDMLKSLVALRDGGVAHEAEPGLWYVTNFAKRQAPLTEAERARLYRNRHGSVTDAVTKSDEGSNEAEVTDSSSTSTSDSYSEGGDARGGSARREWEAGAALGEARQVLEQAAGVLTADFIPKVDVVYQLLRKYGDKEKVIAALVEARAAWCKTERKDKSGLYSALNPAWVDWAVAHLAGETPWKSGGVAADKYQQLLADLEKKYG